MYRITLDSFHGPLDLLLYLVRQHEVDVRDIPVARITEQFLEYLNVMQMLDVELAGDFIVMAATLMEIKSKMLLPRAEREGGEELPRPGEEAADPRRELVRQLVEYRKFKDAAARLGEKAEARTARLQRQAPAAPEGAARPGAPPVRPAELWDLVSAFARLMREAEALRPTPIVVDETPQHVYQDLIRRRLRQEGRIRFRSLFEPPYERSRLIGLFLAMLELIKTCELWLEQPEPFGEIWLRPPP
ncbi:MAG TPA: segregation/condensation protein A, partial [Gemmataceae bacterium]